MTKQPLAQQRMRTRKDILRAAARLLKTGRSPSIEEVAKEALVSRATAYRYFSCIDDILLEAPVDEAVPDPADIFPADSSLGLAERVDQAEAALHSICYKNEPQLRLMLAQCLKRPLPAGGKNELPVRQNRRTDYIDAALKPFRNEFDKETYERLRAALALIFGTEAMIVFRDVVPLAPSRARALKRWMLHALIRAAQDEQRKKG